MTEGATNATGVRHRIGKIAAWVVATVVGAVVSIAVAAYVSDDVDAMLPWHTPEGEIPDCSAPVTDVGIFTVQVESISEGSKSVVSEMFDDQDFCALPPELRPGATNDFTAVMLDRTHPTQAGAFLAACRFADEIRPHVDDLRNAGTGVRSRPSADKTEVEYISADGQECRGALPRSITDPGEFVRTYFDVVGNQDDGMELSAWLSDGFLERTRPAAVARYWNEEVDGLRVADYSTMAEPARASGRAVVAIRLCVDETSEPNKPVALRVALVHDGTSWKIDSATDQAAEPNHCES